MPAALWLQAAAHSAVHPCICGATWAAGNRYGKEFTQVHEITQGRRGRSKTVAQIAVQVEALATAQITLFEWHDDVSTTRVARVADEISFWLERDHRQALVWQPSMTLSQEYYDTLQHHQVPINMDHMLRLTHSPRRMDLYVWLSYRTARIPRGRRVDIRIDDLKAIFGTTISDKHDFRRRFRQDLEVILKIRPFNVTLKGDMLVLRKSCAAVEIAVN